MWLFMAILSAFFAGITSILAKCGIKKTDSDIATAIRTAVVLAQGWDGEGRLEKYLMRLKDRAEGRSVALAAEFHGAVAGYINIYTDSKWGAFAGFGYPEIVDFGVLEKYRRHGIGGRLMDAAEKIASEFADTVYLGVGLHSGYS